MSPGCQVDHTLLIEGPQGIQKSKSLRTLAGDEWFADHISGFGTKDSRIELAGKWIFEFSELRVRRGEIERVKAFLTARTDHFRLPYSRRAEDVPRSCVFAASVNDETSLTDETGNRRFWPVKCGVIDVDGIGKDRINCGPKPIRDSLRDPLGGWTLTN
jgi:putative DNA primase/helicase